MSSELLSLTEAASLLGVHPATLRRWADQGDILVMVTPGGHRRFPRSEIDRLRGASANMEDEEKFAQQTRASRNCCSMRYALSAVPTPKMPFAIT